MEHDVWDKLPETLIVLRLADDGQHRFESTVVRGHSQAAGAKGGHIKSLLIVMLEGIQFSMKRL